MNRVKPSGPTQEIIKRDQVYLWVQQLSDPTTRGTSLFELNKRREVIPDLGVILWNSFGTMTALLQEVVDVYKYFNPLYFTTHHSQRLCNVLNLLKSVASHPEAKVAFVKAQIPNYIYPLLKLYKGGDFENVRLASLKILEGLVRNDNEEAMRYLLTTDVLLHTMDIMEKDFKPAKVLALSILQGILSHDDGLMIICDTHERFCRVTTALGNVAYEFTEDSARTQDESEDVGYLLRLVVQCYWRLSQNCRAREALERFLPDYLMNGTFSQIINEDLSTNCVLTELLDNLNQCPYSFSMQ